MNNRFNVISKISELSAQAVQDLKEVGFIVIPGAVKSEDLALVGAAYDAAVCFASSDDKRRGSFSTRVNDFVNRGEGVFDSLYLYPPLLEASFRLIRQPFKLSSMHARTLHPNSQAQELHIDFKPDEERFPLVGFILMVDEFCNENGATRFVPGSHKWLQVPTKLTNDALANYESQSQMATGQAGSMIIFNGSVWHGHSANMTDRPRRSIQGAFIPRVSQAATDFQSRMNSETRARIGSLAKYLLFV
ncbi:MAG: phytanoyl-CoA dioxygenase family protein [Pyrinomonadaceae bacterium]